MNILIIGGGQVGLGIAQYLNDDFNNVTIIDSDPWVVDKIANKIDVQVVLGSGANPEILEKSGIEDAEMILTTTSTDEVNIIACYLAATRYQTPLKIARLRQDIFTRSDVFHGLKQFIDVVINPEREVANVVSRNIALPGAFDLKSALNDKVKIIGMHCHSLSPIKNTPIGQVEKLLIDNYFQIVLVRRENEYYFADPKFIIKEGDEFFYICSEADTQIITNTLASNPSENREVIIVGGGKIGLNIAKEIEDNIHNISAKIIERSQERCENLAKHLKNTEIFHGDALDMEMLEEVKIQNIETLISVTNDDRVNILTALVAKKYGAKRTLTLLKNTQYASLVKSLGTDTIISPGAISITSVLHFTRNKALSRVYQLGDSGYLLVEANVRENSQILGLSTNDIEVPSGIEVIAMQQNNKILLKPKNIYISSDDILLILAHKESLQKIEKLFAIRPYFL